MLSHKPSKLFGIVWDVNICDVIHESILECFSHLTYKGQNEFEIRFIVSSIFNSRYFPPKFCSKHHSYALTHIHHVSNWSGVFSRGPVSWNRWKTSTLFGCHASLLTGLTNYTTRVMTSLTLADVTRTKDACWEHHWHEQVRLTESCLFFEELLGDFK